MPAASTISFTSRVVRISRRSGCVGDRLGEPLAQRAREVLGQPARERRGVGQVRGEHPGVQVELGVCDERRQLGTGQPLPRRLQRGEPGLVGQHLQVPVDAAAGLEVRDEPPVHADHARRVRPADAQQRVLGAVVGEHQVGDLVGHLHQQRVARLAVHRAVRDQPVEQDLDVDLVVAAVDARGVVDRIGVDLPAVAGELDAAPLGQPQVAALADDLDAQLARIGPDRVVGLVARRRRGSPRSP